MARAVGRALPHVRQVCYFILTTPFPDRQASTGVISNVQPGKQKQGVSNLPQIRALVGGRPDCGPGPLDSRAHAFCKPVLLPPSTTSLMANVIPRRAPSALPWALPEEPEL